MKVSVEFLVCAASVILTGCGENDIKNIFLPSRASTFTLKCYLLPQKIHSHVYVIDEGASKVKDGLNETYGVSFTSEEITWRENYPASAKSYGLHTINRSTAIEKILFFSTDSGKQTEEEDYLCEKIDNKF